MPLADDALDAARPSPARSPRLVRGVLVGALALGLLGLGLSSGSPAVSATSAASSTALVEPAALHQPRFVKPRPARATRTRALPAKAKAKPVVRKQTATWVRPSWASVVSPFGPRWGRMHKGVDFGAGYGAPIKAVGDGVVVGSGYLSSESGYGIITLIRHSNGYVTAYAHQSKSFVGSGDVVHAGDIIGLVGSTGHSTGAHLHFEVRTETHGGQINPLPWLRERGVSI